MPTIEQNIHAATLSLHLCLVELLLLMLHLCFKSTKYLSIKLMRTLPYSAKQYHTSFKPRLLAPLDCRLRVAA